MSNDKKSIGDDAEFVELMNRYAKQIYSNLSTYAMDEARSNLVAYIDARASQMEAALRNDPLLIARIKRYAKVFSCSVKEAKEACDADRDMNPERTEFLDSTAPRNAGVVLYQYRTRADWVPGWGGWTTCSKASYEDYLKCPLLHDWHYEVRTLGVIEPVAAEAPDLVDPIAWPLPCDVKVGICTIKQGCPLSTLVARMNVMNDMIREGWSSARPAPDLSVRDTYCPTCKRPDILDALADADMSMRDAAQALLDYLDAHDWGGVPEGETANRLRSLLKSKPTPAVVGEAMTDYETPAREVWQALNDLSFSCFGGIGVVAPDRATYNTTFTVMEKYRAILAKSKGGA
jgi:hypothetical protein